jgi:hypothetical protein
MTLFSTAAVHPQLPQIDARRFLPVLFATALAVGLVALCLADADPVAVPQSVQELWADFDPRRDPLEVETIREWREDGGVFRHVRFLVGTFKDKPARMAAMSPAAPPPMTHRSHNTASGAPPCSRAMASLT